MNTYLPNAEDDNQKKLTKHDTVTVGW